MKLDDTSHIVIQHFFLYQCLDPLHGYDWSLQAGKGTQAKVQPYHSHHLYVGFFTLLSGSESVSLACNPGPFTLNKLFTSTSVVSQFHRQELLP